MTIASAIITAAYRQENIIAAGTTETSAEQTEALALLNDLMYEVIGTELGELVCDWVIPRAQTAPFKERNPYDPYAERTTNENLNMQPIANSRLLTKISAAKTVYFPEWPSDGARMTLADVGSTSATLTLDGNGRQIEDAASVNITVPTTTEREWFYRADLSNWVRLTDLALGTEQPFPRKYDRMLVTGLAIQLAPHTGREPKQITVDTFEKLRAKFKAQYKQVMPTPATHHLGNVQSHMQAGTGDFSNG